MSVWLVVWRHVGGADGGQLGVGQVDEEVVNDKWNLKASSPKLMILQLFHFKQILTQEFLTMVT